MKRLPLRALRSRTRSKTPYDAVPRCCSAKHPSNSRRRPRNWLAVIGGSACETSFSAFAGYKQHDHPVHRAIASLSPGDRLEVRNGSNRQELLDRRGAVVGQLARGFKAPDGVRCTFATVLAVVTWDRQRSEPQYEDSLQCDAWEVVVPELVFEPDS